ncbi:T6SS immunity protein Tli4 family protein [Paraburkholderia sp. CNPSo 3281]|uniref:T6SS immunity protein Tli4 family protein n=1 Tax=Paraburkholderia sp. CNPSo 3281 TaxID=2940933 RepID=UPI0020B7557E|nr:T6SS immunity protein Tli4 family protein [Paraburkholderia sp. CNPSo 3281]MCP3713838.1 T6SS immunity protein Tli4 family protein [Paraburkholderia sp. CNPSo 3281]
MLAAACLIFTVAACDHKPAPLSQQEKQIVTELTADMKTRCVGRYLVDMPGDPWEWGRAKIQGVSIEAKAMTEDAWRQEVAQREEALKSTTSRDAYPFLYAAGKARGDNTYYFVHRGTIYEAPNRRYIEGYKWDRGYRFLLKVKTYDYTRPDRTNDPIVKQFGVKNEVPEKTAVVFSLMDKLRGRAPDEVPTEPGVCFAGGFLRSPAGSNEDVHAQFGWDNMQDVSFDMSTTPDICDSTTLLQRADGAEMHAELKAADGHLVRKGPVALTGMRAEEWLAEGRMDGGGRGNLFSLFVNETTSGPSTPYLSLDLTTGGQIEIQGKLVKLEKRSLTTGEAVALWDAVSRTLRMRPGAL